MSFASLSPPMKKNGGGSVRVTAKVNVLASGEVRCFLNLSAALVAKLDGAKAAHVLAGDGEHEGFVRVEYGAAGDFEITHRKAKDARLYLPDISWLPRQPTNAALCRITALGNGVLVLRLPLNEWSSAAQARKPRAA